MYTVVSEWSYGSQEEASVQLCMCLSTQLARSCSRSTGTRQGLSVIAFLWPLGPSQRTEGSVHVGQNRPSLDWIALMQSATD